MLPTYTYPEILTASHLLSKAGFILATHPLHIKQHVIWSGKLWEEKPELWKKMVNGNLPPALQIFKLALASRV